MGRFTTRNSLLAREASEPGASRLKHHERSVQRLPLPFHGLYDASGKGAPSPGREADQNHPRRLAVRGEDELPEVFVFGEKYTSFPDRKSNNLSAEPGQPTSRSFRPQGT